MASMNGSGPPPSRGSGRGSTSYLNRRPQNDVYQQNQQYDGQKSMSAAAAKMDRRRRGEIKRVQEPYGEGLTMSSASSMPNLLDGNMSVRSNNPFSQDFGSTRNLSQSNRSLHGSNRSLHEANRSHHGSQRSLHESNRSLHGSNRSLNASTHDLRQRQGSLHRSMNDVSNISGSRSDLYRSSQGLDGSRNDLHRSSQGLNGSGLSGSRNDLYRNPQSGLNGSRNDLHRSTQGLNGSSLSGSRNDLHRSAQGLNGSGLSGSRNDMHRSTQGLNGSGLSGSRPDLHRSTQGLSGSGLSGSRNDLHRSTHSLAGGGLTGSRNDVHRSAQGPYGGTNYRQNDPNDMKKSWQDLNSLSGSRRDIFNSSQDVNGSVNGDSRRSRNDLRQSAQDVNQISRSRQDVYRSNQDVRNMSNSSSNISGKKPAPQVPHNQTDMHRSRYDLTRVGRNQDGRQRNGTDQYKQSAMNNDIASVHRSTQDLNRNSWADKKPNDNISRSVHDVRGISASRNNINDIHKSWNNVSKSASRSTGNIANGGAMSAITGQGWTSARDMRDPLNATGSQRDMRNTPSQSVSSMASNVSSSTQGPSAPPRRGNFYNSKRGRKKGNVNNQNGASSSSLSSTRVPVNQETNVAVAVAVASAVAKESNGRAVSRTPEAKTPRSREASAYIDDQADRYQNGVPMRKGKAKAPVPNGRPVSQMSQHSYASAKSYGNSTSNLTRLPQDLLQSYNSVYGEATAGKTFQVQAEVIPESLNRSYASIQSEPRSTTSSNPSRQLQNADSITNITDESFNNTMSPASSVATLAFSELDDDDNKALLNKSISTWSLLSNGALVPGLPFKTARFVFPMTNLFLMSIAAIFVSLSLGDPYWLETSKRDWWFGLDGMFNGQCGGNPSSGDDGMAKGSFAMVVMSFILQVATLVGIILNFTLSQGYIKIYTVPKLEKWSLMAAVACVGVSAFLLIIAAALFSSLGTVPLGASLSDSFILAIIAILTLAGSTAVLIIIFIRQRKRL